MTCRSLVAMAGLAISLILSSQGVAVETGDAYTKADEALIASCKSRIEKQWDTAPEQRMTYYNCIGVIAEACQAEAPENTTTIGMAACAHRETLYWDDRLNRAYGLLRDNMDPDLFTQLRDTQRAWISFRDAECAFQYQFWIEGTIRTIFGSSCQLQLTAERALELEEVLRWMDLE